MFRSLKLTDATLLRLNDRQKDRTGQNGVKKLLFVSLVFQSVHFLKRPPTGVNKLLFVRRKDPQIPNDGKNGIK
jgi:hypothetical protein